MLQDGVTVVRAVFLTTLLVGAVVACSKPSQEPVAAASAAQEAPASAGPQSTASAQTGTAEPGASASSTAPQKIEMTDIKKGTGPVIQSGQTAVVHYTGWLYTDAAPENKGKKFDSSRDRNQPFSFPLGGGQVIQGWDEGVAGMQVGGQRRLVIPPEMGYGAAGAGGVIPANATLVFDVELLAIQ